MTRPLKSRGWYGQVFAMEFKKFFSYRASFWIDIGAGLVVHVAVAWFLWSAIFDFKKASQISGFSLPALMVYYAMVPLLRRMIRGHDAGFVVQDIYDGGLTKYLVYPVSFMEYRWAGNMALTIFFTIQFFLVLAGFQLFFGMPEGIHFSQRSLFLGLTAVALASVLYFLCMATLEMVAFWADNVWGLSAMFKFVANFLSGAMIPLALFPSWAQTLSYYLPFPYFADFPIVTMIGKLSFEKWVNGMLMMSAWCCVLALICRMVWRRGLKSYTGVGI